MTDAVREISLDNNKVSLMSRFQCLDQVCPVISTWGHLIQSANRQQKGQRCKEAGSGEPDYKRSPVTGQEHERHIRAVLRRR